MWKWVIPVTIAVLVAGVAIMFTWTTVNHLFAGEGAAVNWLATFISILVIFVIGGLFVTFSSKLAVIAEQEESSSH